MRAIVAGMAVAVGLASGAAADPEADHLARMAQEHADDAPVASEAARAAPAASTTGDAVEYATVDGAPVRGYLARPAAADGAVAGVIVIHEWWGLNDNIRAMADRLAGEGYAALAVDLYEGEAAGDPRRARELAGATRERRAALESNLRQAHAYLSGELGAAKVGTIGWCFGGGWSLGTALLLPAEIDATVIYYGRVVTERERLAPLQTPILGHFGAEDRGIPVSQVRAFEAALAELGKRAHVHVYDGANHAFANPSGTRYHAAAAEQAWARTLAFFAEHLKR